MGAVMAVNGSTRTTITSSAGKQTSELGEQVHYIATTQMEYIMLKERITALSMEINRLEAMRDEYTAQLAELMRFYL